MSLIPLDVDEVYRITTTDPPLPLYNYSYCVCVSVCMLWPVSDVLSLLVLDDFALGLLLVPNGS